MLSLLTLAFFLLHIVACYSELGSVHPAYSKTVIGHSVMDAEIAVYRAETMRGAPKVLLVGNIHGNEISGFDLLVSLLQTEPRANARLDILYLPTMNPDGMYYDIRENADRVDLNRAFPDECNRTNSTLTVESRAVMRFIEDERPLVVIVFHGGTSVVVWGPEQNCTSDALSVATSVTPFQQNLMTAMAGIYARTLHVGTVEGSIMYQVAGSLPGYAVPRFSQLALTIEMDAQKEPSEKREAMIVSKHTFALFDLLNEIRDHTVHLSNMASVFPTEHFSDNDGYLIYYEKQPEKPQM